MADGGLTLEIDSTLAERLRAVAAASGESVEVFALEALRAAADDDWAEDVARYETYKRTGRFLDAETEMKAFQEAVRQSFHDPNK